MLYKDYICTFISKLEALNILENLNDNNTHNNLIKTVNSKMS